MKNYLRTQITLYEEDKKDDASMWCSLLHGSWDQVLQRCMSVCLSVRLLYLFHYVPIIVSSWNVQELLPMTDLMSIKRSRSKVKVTKVMTPLSRFRTVPFWIHIWQWNDAQSLLVLRKGALLFFKVICQIPRTQLKNHWFWPKLGVSWL